MVKVLDMKKGRLVIYQDDMYVVKDKTHVAKGNKRSYVQAQLKNFDVRFNMDERLETPFVETREFEYLYAEGDALVLMNTKTYDQMHVDKELFGDQLKFLKPNEKVTCAVHEEAVIQVELPNVVELQVADAPPVVKGATATNQPKDAILETGAKVRVPVFIAIGEKIRVDTRSGEYIERAK